MRKWRLVAVLAGLVLVGIQVVRADSTWVYAVQLTAELQTNPPAITLNWIQDMYGADSYTVYRKAKEDTNWGDPVIELDGSITNYTDTNVQVGVGYEYQVVKDASLGYSGFGYIYSGINVPLIENRGTLILVVAKVRQANAAKIATKPFEYKEWQTKIN